MTDMGISQESVRVRFAAIQKERRDLQVKIDELAGRLKGIQAACRHPSKSESRLVAGEQICDDCGLYFAAE